MNLEDPIGRLVTARAIVAGMPDAFRWEDARFRMLAGAERLRPIKRKADDAVIAWRFGPFVSSVYSADNTRIGFANRVIPELANLVHVDDSDALVERRTVEGRELRARDLLALRMVAEHVENVNDPAWSYAAHLGRCREVEEKRIADYIDANPLGGKVWTDEGPKTPRAKAARRFMRPHDPEPEDAPDSDWDAWDLFPGGEG